MLRTATLARQQQRRAGRAAEIAALRRHAMAAAFRELRRQAWRRFHVTVEMPDVHAAWETASEKLRGATREGVEEVGNLLLAKVREYSAVQYFSLVQLRRMGHPYARRFAEGAAGMPDYVVNRQSGDFLNSWQMRVSREGDTVGVDVYNTSPHAKYLRGTRKMRARPLQEAAFQHTAAERKNALERLKRRVVAALREGFTRDAGGRWRGAGGRFARPPGV